MAVRAPAGGSGRVPEPGGSLWCMAECGDYGHDPLDPQTWGGRRPIGILPTVVRVWERCRKIEVQRWLHQNRRKFDWATSGRSAEMAAWHQSITDEAATAQGLTSVGAFLDLAKAFENVRLQDIWAAGRRLHFPLVVLRVTLEAFAFSRRLVYQQAISEPVGTLSAILAGGGSRRRRCTWCSLSPWRPYT